MKKLVCLLIAALLFLTSCSNSKPMPVLKSGVYKAATSDAYIEVFDDNTLQINGFDLTDVELDIEEQIISIQDLNEKDARELREKIDLNRDFTGHKVQYVFDVEWFERIGYVFIEFPLGIEYDGYEEKWNLVYFPVGNKLVLKTYGYNSDTGTNEIFTLTE